MNKKFLNNNNSTQMEDPMSSKSKSVEKRALDILKNKSVSQYDFVVLTECLRFKDRGQDTVRNKEIILATGLDEQIVAKSLGKLEAKKILFKVSRGYFSLEQKMKRDPVRVKLEAELAERKDLLKETLEKLFALKAG